MSKRKATTAARAAESDRPDPAEVRRGAEAFCRLLRDIKVLPEVLRPGYSRGEDDSLAHDYIGAERLIRSRLESGEFEGEGRHVGYFRALASYLINADADEWTADLVMRFFDRAAVNAERGPDGNDEVDLTADDTAKRLWNLIMDADMDVSRVGSLVETITDITTVISANDPGSVLRGVARIETLAHFAAIAVRRVHNINTQVLRSEARHD